MLSKMHHCKEMHLGPEFAKMQQPEEQKSFPRIVTQL